MIKSDFAIKGQRDYLSGSIVLDFILQQMRRDPHELEIVFYKKTLNNCLFTEAAPPDGSVSVARYRDRQGTVHVLETPEVIQRRVDYPEAQVVAACRFQGAEAEVPAAIADFSFIEKLVAAYKHMLQQMHAGEKRRFIFVQLRMERLPAGTFTVRHERKLGNGFFQATVLEAGDRIGTVFFNEW